MGNEEASMLCRAAIFATFVVVIAAAALSVAGSHFSAQDLIAGAVTMCVTLFFYAELARMLLAQDKRLRWFTATALLKVFLIACIVYSGALSDGERSLWLVIGFLGLLPLVLAIRMLLSPTRSSSAGSCSNT